MSHSDVDLMAIGEVTLWELTLALGDMEPGVPRELNAVAMRPDQPADRLAQEEVFTLNVLRGPKLCAIREQGELAGLLGPCGERVLRPLGG